MLEGYPDTLKFIDVQQQTDFLQYTQVVVPLKYTASYGMCQINIHMKSKQTGECDALLYSV